VSAHRDRHSSIGGPPSPRAVLAAAAAAAAATGSQHREAATCSPINESAFDALRGVDSFPGGEEEALCPDLIVPGTCECILVVPIRPLDPNLGSVSVTDMGGDAVLRVTIFCGGGAARPPALSSAASLGGRVRPSGGGGGSVISFDPLTAVTQGVDRSGIRLVLQTAQGEPLAHCRTCHSQEFVLFRSSGEHFARITAGTSRDRYVLATPGGAELSYWGSIAEYNVSVADASGKLLAMTERCSVDFDPKGSYYRMRVAPLTDVGLIVCSLLCIQQLNALR